MWKGLNDSYNQEAIRVMGSFDGVFAVCNYKTGELISCVDVVSGENNAKTEDFDNSENMFLYGQFIPGSTMKITTSIAAIRESFDSYNKQYVCHGYLENVSGNVTCPRNHGPQYLSEALGNSCNCYFGNLALSIGRNKMLNNVRQLGFNRQLKFNGVKISKSVFNPTDDTDFAWSCIGQASTRINPAHYLALISTIANNGVCSIKGIDLSLTKQESYRIKDLLHNNVQQYYGINRFRGLDVSGKTGTAEINGQNSNSLFVGFINNDETPYAFICIIKEGGGKRNKAIEISSEILNYIVKNEGEHN